MALSKRLKDLKRKAGQIIPDPLEDLVSQAKRYISDPLDVAKDIGRLAYETPTFGQKTSIKEARKGYDVFNTRITDPVREVTQIAGEEDFDPIATARKTYDTARGKGLGESFRARPNTLGKRVIENVIDPLNLIGFGVGIAGAKSAGQPLTKAVIRSAIREMAAPAAGQVGGNIVGGAVAGERGAQVGEMAGLLGGAFGPNLIGNKNIVQNARSAPRAAPGMAVVPQDATSSRYIPDSEYQQALRRNYFEGDEKLASSRTKPADMPDYPLGSWRIDDQFRGNHGREISQLRELDPKVLEASEDELRWRSQDVDRYAEWLRQGLKPPPIEVVETERGALRITNGHRRWAAAKAAGVPVRAWVSPVAPIFPERLTSEGTPMLTGLTDELAERYGIALGRDITPAATRQPPRGVMGIAPSDRFYHGTGSVFDAPDPVRFDNEGLFGPGYYMTDDPRVASSYATTRADEPAKARAEAINERADLIDQMKAGKIGQTPALREMVDERITELQAIIDRAVPETAANVRPVNVPKNLKMLDAESEMKPAEIRRFASKMAQATGSQYFANLAATPPREISWLSRRFAGMIDEWRNTEPMEWEDATRALSAIGYDGIRYDGGRRVPLMDDGGNPIQHTAVVVFPDKLKKIKNALSGTAMGISPTDRFYHGTADTFDTPDATKFDPNGLFGPGYYLTSDPRVASDYARARAPIDDEYITTRSDLIELNSHANQRLSRAERSYNESGRIHGVADEDAIDHLAALRRERNSLNDELSAFENRKEEFQYGQQVRPIDAPRDLNLFDIEQSLPPASVEAIAIKFWPHIQGDEYADLRNNLQSLMSGTRPTTGAALYEAMQRGIMLDRAMRGGSGLEAKEPINRLLKLAGFDGIRYDGGKRIPLNDDDGNPIRHTAVAIFPEAMDKLTNALSGTKGGLLPDSAPAGRSARDILQLDAAGLKADVPGALFGAAAGAGKEIVFDDERDPGEIAKSALVGGLFGATGSHVRRIQSDVLPVSRITGDSGRPAIVGTTSDAFSIKDPSVRYQFRYKVVDLDDLVPSHTDDLQKNPGFPSEVQPRLRERAASQMQIDRGPMIVGSDNVVESGNGRVLALRRARQEYPEQFASYRANLRQRAADYGLNPAQLDALENPVLVRERLSDVDRAAFAEEANASSGLGMSSFEQAMGDSTRFSDETVQNLVVGENQTLDAALTAAANRPVAQAFIGTIPENDRATFVDESGALNQAGLARLKAALFARTFPGDAGRRLTKLFFESLDPGLKNIENAMYAALPNLSRAEALIRQGARQADLSIADDLSKAANALNRLREEGISVSDFMRQQAMFERELTPFQEMLLQFLDENRRQPVAIRTALKEFATLVEAQPHANQAGLFGDVVRKSKGELFDAAVQRNPDDARGLFADAATKPVAAPDLPRPTPAAAADSPQLAGATDDTEARLDAIFPGRAAERAERERIRGMASPQRIAGQVGDDEYLRANPDAQPLSATDDIVQNARSEDFGGRFPPPPPREPPREPPPGAGSAGEADDAFKAEPSPEVRKRSVLGMAGMILNMGKQGMLSGDAGQFGRIGIEGVLQAASAGKPVAGLRGLARATLATFSPKYAEAWKRGTVGQRWMDRLGITEKGVSPEFSTWTNRVPGLGHLERAMFDRFTPVMAGEVAEAMEQGMRNAGDFAKMSETERADRIGHWVRNALIGKPIDEVTQNKAVQAIAKFSLLSPRWTAGKIAEFGNLGSTGPEGELARRFWGTTLFTALALSVSVTAAATGKDPLDLLDPTNPDSVIDPRKSRQFLAIKLKDGTTISPFQPMMPVLRLLTRPIAAGSQAFEEEGGFNDIANAAIAFAESGAGEARKATTQYLLGRSSPPIRLFNDLEVTGEDFFGNPIVTKEGVAGLGQAAAYAGRQYLPIIAQPLAEQVERVPGTAPTLGGRALEMGANFFGVQAKPGERLPQEAAQQLRAGLIERGVRPSAADNELMRQFGDLNLDDDERSAFYKNNPAVRKFLDDKTKLYGNNFDRPEGLNALNVYNGQRKILEDARDEALKDMERRNLAGDAYRAERATVMTRYRERNAQLQRDILGSDDPDRVAAAFDAIYKNDRPEGELRKALNGLYAIRQDGDSAEQRDDYFERRDAYLATLSPEIRQRMLDNQMNNAPTDTERAYLQAARVYGEYAKIPAYIDPGVGMDIKQSRQATKDVAAARDYASATGLPAKLYLVEQFGDDQDRMVRAITALKGKVNPERKAYRQANVGPFTRFYSGLDLGLVDSILGQQVAGAPRASIFGV